MQKKSEISLNVTEFQNTVFLPRNLNRRDQLSDLGTAKHIILKMTLMKWCLKM
jgi:hypothetical protein